MPEAGPEPRAGARCVLKTSADVKALTYCGLQQLSSRGLAEVLRLYPEYRTAFRAGLLRDLTFNLRQGCDTNVRRVSHSKGPSFQTDLSQPHASPRKLHSSALGMFFHRPFPAQQLPAPPCSAPWTTRPSTKGTSQPPSRPLPLHTVPAWESSPPLPQPFPEPTLF